LARHAQAATDDKPLEQLPVLLQQIASRLSDVRDLLQSGGSSSGKSEQVNEFYFYYQFIFIFNLFIF